MSPSFIADELEAHSVNTEPSAFGTPSNSLFGAKPASTPLFGGATSTPTFGGGQTSAFGQSTPSTSFSFGGSGTTSAFGQPQQNSTFGGFGQPAANTNDGTVIKIGLQFPD